MKVLLPIDNSTHSDDAIENVASRQWPSGTEFEVLTVVHAPAPLPDPAFVMAAIYVERTHELLEHAPELMNQAAARIRQRAPHMSVTTKVLEGLPTDVILKEAGDWGADLIVLGSHGRSAVKQAMLGSVASGVAAAASCAVEIIRSRRPKVTASAARSVGDD